MFASESEIKVLIIERRKRHEISLLKIEREKSESIFEIETLVSIQWGTDKKQQENYFAFIEETLNITD